LRLSTGVQKRRLAVRVACGFLDARALTQLPDSPADYGLAFRAPESALPADPGSALQNSPVPPASPASKPSSSRESVRAVSSLPEATVDPLLGFCLSRAFSVHAWDPRTRPDRWGLSMSPPPEGQGHDARDLATPRPGEATPTRMHRGILVGRFRPPSGPARTASRRRSCSHGLRAPGEPVAPDLRSLAVRGKRRFSGEIACSSEVLDLVDSLVTSKSPQARAYGFTSWSDACLQPAFQS
jgi:hypothetical protein